MKQSISVIFGLAFIGIGVLHFLRPDSFLAIMPEWIPFHLFGVYASGVVEIVGGIGLLIPRYRKIAGWTLLALLIVVFPANINMAINEIQLPGRDPFPTWALWARLPFQFVLMYIVWWAAIKKS
ncbi:MAG: DoxX family protein [Balneolaceae bacterium]|nr:DoxX family protein [Balneolaceae bacterium]